MLWVSSYYSCLAVVRWPLHDATSVSPAFLYASSAGSRRLEHRAKRCMFAPDLAPARVVKKEKEDGKMAHPRAWSAIADDCSRPDQTTDRSCFRAVDRERIPE